MSLIKKTGVVGTALFVAMLSSVATAPAAQAATTAPACIDRYYNYDGGSLYVNLTNECSTTKKVKVDIKFGNDSPCWTIKPGKSKYWFYDGIGSYRKTVLC